MMKLESVAVSFAIVIRWEKFGYFLKGRTQKQTKFEAQHVLNLTSRVLRAVRF